MAAQTKDSTIGMQTNVRRILPRLRAIEGFETTTELTRVGPAWRHVISEPDTLESEPPPNFEEDASQALHDFRAEQDRRRRNMVPVMFVMGCSIGILLALIPDSRFFRNHILHAAAAPPPRVVLPAAAPVAPPPEAQSGLAMSPIDVRALMPTSMPVAVVTAAPQATTPKRAHASSASAARSSSPMPVARTSSAHAKAHPSSDDEETVKNAHAADDMAAAQLTDSL